MINLKSYFQPCDEPNIFVMQPNLFLSSLSSPSSIPRFPELLHQILEDANRNGDTDIVSWLPCGRWFKVHEVQRFARELMPKYFSHTSYKSFLRQLSLYQYKRGSRKSLPGPQGSYSHPSFRRDRRDLALKVIRVKNRPTTVLSNDDSTSSNSNRDEANEESFLFEDGNKNYLSGADEIISIAAFDKYLDPRLILQAQIFSRDILDEIVHTFGRPAEDQSHRENRRSGIGRRESHVEDGSASTGGVLGGYNSSRYHFDDHTMAYLSPKPI